MFLIDERVIEMFLKNSHWFLSPTMSGERALLVTITNTTNTRAISGSQCGYWVLLKPVCNGAPKAHRNFYENHDWADVNEFTVLLYFTFYVVNKNE